MIVDGRLLFSKKQVGRFPNPGEVEELLAQLKAGKEFPEPATVSGNSGFVGRLLAKLRG